MKAISYALFGYNRAQEHNCFSFSSYLRGLHICIRFNRILYPEWMNVLNLDHETYNSPYKPIFDWHLSKGWLRLSLQDSNTPLCKAMLWRFKTVFDYDHPEWRYSHVICRDLDSISTYREAQMVAEWIKEDKAMHCITDSISHTIPMMGGLVGFRPGYIKDLLKVSVTPELTFDHLLSRAKHIDYRIKGTDQTFLNEQIYPSLADHATEHFIKGMSHNKKEENGRHYRVSDVWPEWIIESQKNLPAPFSTNITAWVEKLQETNLLAGHAGAAGFYETPTMKFLYWDDPYRDEYKELETMEGFEQIFYWSSREDLR